KIKELNQKLKLKLDQRQVYRDLVVLSNQLSSSIESPLQYLINSKSLVLRQEEELSEKIFQHISNEKILEDVYVALAKLTATIHRQAEQIDSVCFKLAQQLPSFEELAPSDLFSHNSQYPGEVSLEEALQKSIACIRPIIYDEYQLNIWDILTLDFLADKEEKISEPHRLIILLSRIFDEVLLQCQLEDKPFPKIEVTTQSTGDSSEIAIAIHRAYQPQELTQYFCQGILDFYGGELSVKQEDNMTYWTILLPLN
ncbi:MAG: hypothetical protein ACRDEA_14820, partial [Microcystaceae cyanobacterium]